MHKPQKVTKDKILSSGSVAVLLRIFVAVTLAATAQVQLQGGSWKDTDNDGLVDTYLPDVGETDTDTDGIPDDVEFLYGLNNLDPLDAQLDLDDDGFSNLKAYNRNWPIDASWYGVDTDGDSINDVTESHWVEIFPILQSGQTSNPDLDPFADPDGDGVLTKEELDPFYSLNPALAQSVAGTDDWDTFAFSYEYWYGISPVGGGSTGDVDSDGMADEWEYAYFLNYRDPLDSLLDFDNDSLDNAAEFANGTNPYIADTDGDGEDDAQEASQGTDPTDPNSSMWGNSDYDNDGLTNAQELALGTDPNLSDSDFDGIDDATEVSLGSNPAVADTDSDGLTDGQESAYGSDPLRADTDLDNLSDGAEVNLGTDPVEPDSDGDDHSDGKEVSNGSDPLDTDSFPESGLAERPMVKVTISMIEAASGLPEQVEGMPQSDGSWWYNFNKLGWGYWSSEAWGDPSYVFTYKHFRALTQVMAGLSYSDVDQRVHESAAIPTGIFEAAVAWDHNSTYWEACWKRYKFKPEHFPDESTPPSATYLILARSGLSTIFDAAVVDVEFNDLSSEGQPRIKLASEESYLSSTIVVSGTELKVEPKLLSGQLVTVSMVDVEFRTDLNNDGELSILDTGFRLLPYKEGATEENIKAGTEYLFANDSLSNGKWDVQDTNPDRPSTEDGDDDVEKIGIKVGMEEGEVWLDHPAIAGIKFYDSEKCTQEVQISPSSHFTVTSSNPLPDTIYARAESVTFAESEFQKEGDLKLMVKVAGASAATEAAKIKFAIVKQMGAPRFFQAARDYILESNTELFAHNWEYPLSGAPTTIIRMCIMREEATKMHPWESYWADAKKEYDANGPPGTPFNAVLYAYGVGIEGVMAVDSNMTAVINGNLCGFLDGTSTATAALSSGEGNPFMTDKCQGRVVIGGVLNPASNDHYDKMTNAPGTQFKGNALAGPDPLPGTTTPGGKYILQTQEGKFSVGAGQVPLSPMPNSAMGGLSTYYDYGPRSNYPNSIVCYVPVGDTGKGGVFIACGVDFTKGKGRVGEFYDDAILSGVPLIAGAATTPQNIQRPPSNLLLLDSGDDSPGMSHKDPSGNLNLVIKGRKHDGYAYYVNTFLRFKAEKARSE